jgi:hypothetical protein
MIENEVPKRAKIDHLKSLLVSCHWYTTYSCVGISRNDLVDANSDILTPLLLRGAAGRSQSHAVSPVLTLYDFKRLI